MPSPILIPLPMANLTRWFIAFNANAVHLIHIFTSAGEASLPPGVEASMATRPAHNWAEFAQLASDAALSGLAQLGEAIFAYPSFAAAAAWVGYETVLLIIIAVRRSGLFANFRRKGAEKCEVEVQTPRARAKPAPSVPVYPSKATGKASRRDELRGRYRRQR